MFGIGIALQILYKYIIAYGNSTQQLCAAVRYPVQASAEKICICKFTKRSGLHEVMVIEKNLERRRHRRADPKNLRRRRKQVIGGGGAIGAGI